MMSSVTKATPIHFIESNCHSHINRFNQSHYVTSLVINALGNRYTHTHAHMPMCKQKQFQETRCAPATGLKIPLQVNDHNYTPLLHLRTC